MPVAGGVRGGRRRVDREAHELKGKGVAGQDVPIRSEVDDELRRRAPNDQLRGRRRVVAVHVEQLDRVGPGGEPGRQPAGDRAVGADVQVGQSGRAHLHVVDAAALVEVVTAERDEQPLVGVAVARREAGDLGGVQQPKGAVDAVPTVRVDDPHLVVTGHEQGRDAGRQRAVRVGRGRLHHCVDGEGRPRDEPVAGDRQGEALVAETGRRRDGGDARPGLDPQGAGSHSTGATRTQELDLVVTAPPASQHGKAGAGSVRAQHERSEVRAVWGRRDDA